ncbi:MAG: UvrD-helicase domain-containing protein [Candidatus Sericytochromatia bacterium]|nr:UvrD-helicase domain-containing protein [Candidatus Sericytochromatia bacterium]
MHEHGLEYGVSIDCSTAEVPVASYPLLDGLNPPQQAAVTHGSGPLLVLAGAGAGKTRVITHRIAHLVASGQARPDEVLAVTFTNKAANELKERLAHLLEAGGGAGPLFAHQPWMVRGMWVGTFHSICGKVLRFDLDKLPEAGYGPNFVIFDDTDQLGIVKGALERLSLDDKAYPPRAVLAKISGAKSRGLTPMQFHEQARGHQGLQIAAIYEHYQRELARQNALDFDDMLLLTVRLFERCPEVLARYQQRFRYLLVDEYQDTNQVQYALVRQLAAHHRNLCVVGDVDQSIYSFRHADFRIILQFQQDWPDATLIKLEENYRSTRTILTAANHLIAHNEQRFEKQLWTRNAEGEPITLYEALDERDEAEFVQMQIRKRRQNRPLSDFAVLYRTNAQSRALEELFMRWGTPYRLVGGLRFYERKEVKDLLGYLRLVHNPADETAFARVVNTPKRGLGKTTVERVLEAARSAGTSAVSLLRDPASVIDGLTARAAARLVQFAGWIMRLHQEAPGLELAELVRRVATESGYEAALEAEGTEEARARLENLAELVNVASDFSLNSDDKSLGAFLTHLMLLSDADQGGAEPDRVTLMTLHAAKGLEFPVVFLVGLEEAVFPHRRALDDPTQLEEERRLAYVGITRAREALVISHARSRMTFGQTNASLPSRFLTELPPEGLRHATSPLLKLQARAEGPAAPAGTRPAGRRAASGGEVVWMQDWDTAEASERRGGRAPQRQAAPRLPAAALTVGDKVRHATFGEGVVARVIGSGERATLAVSFPGLGQKILDPRFAPLERVRE